jgi:3-deoxy-manno-octulosonate cytidylyltransferase (CMP-KDO synthetase)
MKIVGIIPARYASTRFPGKPLLQLNGKTMIQRVYEGVKKSNKFTEVIVATDDARIYEEVTRFGGSVRMTRDNHQSGTDRCAEIAKDFPEMDVVINIQGDEPLVDYRQLEQLVAAFEQPTTHIATLGIRTNSTEDLHNPNRIKIVVNHAHKALYFSRSAIPNFSNNTGNPIEKYTFLKHIGLYGYRNETLQQISALQPTQLEQIESLEQLRWLYHGYEIQVVETTIETPNIDVPEDVQKVLAFL